MTDADAAAVLAIYAAGLATGDASFETQVPDWAQWSAAHLDVGRLVAIDDEGRLAGWVALSKTSARSAYGGVAEVSVYVRPALGGRGIGRALLAAAVVDAEAAGIWTLQAGVFPENVASLRLHAAAGFRVVGRRERIGQRLEVWRDVVLLERRSRVAGR